MSVFGESNILTLSGVDLERQVDDRLAARHRASSKKAPQSHGLDLQAV